MKSVARTKAVPGVGAVILSLAWFSLTAVLLSSSAARAQAPLEAGKGSGAVLPTSVDLPSTAGLPRYAAGSIRGQLRARQFAVLAAGMSANLSRFPWSHGERVKKGQRLVQFDCRMEQASLDVGKAKRQAAGAKLKVNQRLAELQNISGLELSLSESELAIAEAELVRLRAQLSACDVRAPFSGLITEKFVQAHQFVNKGEPLLELVDTQSLEVEMVVPSRWLPRLVPNTPFTIRLDETGQEAPARVDRIVGAIDPVSQTVRVIGVLEKGTADMLPGMSGTLSFPQAVTDEAVTR